MVFRTFRAKPSITVIGTHRTDIICLFPAFALVFEPHIPCDELYFVPAGKLRSRDLRSEGNQQFGRVTEIVFMKQFVTRFKLTYACRHRAVSESAHMAAALEPGISQKAIQVFEGALCRDSGIKPVIIFAESITVGTDDDVIRPARSLGKT